MYVDVIGHHHASIAYLLRLTKLYDFELAGSVFNPILSSPCSLYRTKDLLVGSVRYYYSGIVISNPDKTGIILGNLRVAEDRVLSYSSLSKVAFFFFCHFFIFAGIFSFF